MTSCRIVALLAIALVGCGDEERPAPTSPPAAPTMEPMSPSEPEDIVVEAPAAAVEEPPVPVAPNDLLRTTPSWIVWPPCMGITEASGLFSARVISPTAAELPTCARGARELTLHVPADASVRGVRLIGVEGAAIERIAVCHREAAPATPAARVVVCSGEAALAEMTHPSVVDGELELTFESPGGDFVLVVEPATAIVRARAIELVGTPGADVRAVPRAPPEQIGVLFSTTLAIESRRWVMAAVPASGPGSVDVLDAELTRRAGRETRIVAAVRAATASGGHPVTVALVLRRDADDEGTSPLFGDLTRLGSDGSGGAVTAGGAVPADSPPPASPTTPSTAPATGVLLRGPSRWLDDECEGPRELSIVRITHGARGAVSTTSEIVLADDVCSPTERRMSVGDLDADARIEVRVRAGWTAASGASDAERPRRAIEVILDLSSFWQEARVVLDDLDDESESTAEAFLEDLDADGHEDLSVRRIEREQDGTVTESAEYFFWDAATDAWLIDPHFTAPAASDRVLRLPRGFAPDPTMLGGTAGGPVSAEDVLGAECATYIATAPNHVLDVPVGLGALTLTAEAPGDTMLVVRLSDGRVLCDDDSAGEGNPMIRGPLPAGRHEVWVGAASHASIAYTLALSETGARASAHVGTMIFEGVPRDCGAAAADYGPIVVGSSVVLGTHMGWTGPDGRGGRVSDDRAWDDAMYTWVGARTVVTELGGIDDAGCSTVRVAADAGRHRWRIRELRP